MTAGNQRRLQNGGSDYGASIDGNGRARDTGANSAHDPAVPVIGVIVATSIPYLC